MDNIKNSFINQVSKLVKQYREYMMSVVHKTNLRVEPSHPEAYPLDELYFSYPLSLTSMLRSVYVTFREMMTFTQLILYMHPLETRLTLDFLKDAHS